MLAFLTCAAWAAFLWRRGSGARQALLSAAADSAVFLVVSTELLGLVRGVTPIGVAIVWALAALAVALLHLRLRGPCPLPRLPGGQVDRLLLGLILAPLLWAFAQAVLAPPNTVDALAYHLPRQVYWLQQGSVEHYPTSVLRQLTMPPLAEYAGLHLLALTGGDRWHNLVQWSAMVGTLVAVTVLARARGAGTRGQLLAALFFLTVPSAFVQASGPKNDLVVAFWLAAAAAAVSSVATRPPGVPDLRLGAQLGALVLTKGTGLLFGAPVALLVLRDIARAPGRLRRLALVAAVAVVLNAGHWSRNLAAFGSLYGPGAATHGGQTVANETFGPRVLLSNALRNLATEMALPVAAWNRALLAVVLEGHDRLGLRPDDLRTTYRPPYVPPFFVPMSEDTAIAPLHVAAALAFPLALLLRRRWAVGPWSELWVLAAAGFLLFCAVLKWQMWHPRLLFPLLALVAPVAGELGARVGGAALLPYAALVALLLPSMNFRQRPLFGRRNVLETPRAVALLNGVPHLQPACERAVEIARQLKPRTVGFVTGWSGYEYAFQSSLSRGLEPPPQFVSAQPSFVPSEAAIGEAPDLLIVDAAHAPAPPAVPGRRVSPLGHAGGFSFYSAGAAPDEPPAR